MVNYLILCYEYRDGKKRRRDIRAYPLTKDLLYNVYEKILLSDEKTDCFSLAISTLPLDDCSRIDKEIAFALISQNCREYFHVSHGSLYKKFWQEMDISVYLIKFFYPNNTSKFSLFYDECDI